jgi:hypothetical protein
MILLSTGFVSMLSMMCVVVLELVLYMNLQFVFSVKCRM